MKTYILIKSHAPVPEQPVERRDALLKKLRAIFQDIIDTHPDEDSRERAREWLKKLNGKKSG